MYIKYVNVLLVTSMYIKSANVLLATTVHNFNHYGIKKIASVKGVKEERSSDNTRQAKVQKRKQKSN